MSNRQAMQNPSPGQTDHLTPYRLLELQSAQCFCCCFSAALKSQECSNTSFPNGQRETQIANYDNCLFSHQASNTALPSDLERRVFLEYKQYLLSRRLSEDENERPPHEYLSYPWSKQVGPENILGKIPSENALFIHYLLFQFQSRCRYF